MTLTDSHAAALIELRATLTGDLVLPHDERWDTARRAWQLLVDQHPVAVVFAETVADVAATVSAAAALGLRVAPQATGHAAGSVPDLDDTILLSTARMRDVVVDTRTAVATVAAGALSADVATALAPHGVVALSGMSPDVGVVGFTLGGGLGWLGRSHGLAADSVIAIDAVDPTGEVLRIDAQHHEELFWAMRGGVSPVIVTAIHVRLHALESIYAGALMWPIERADEVVHAWGEWVADAPESATSLVRVLRYPPLPDLPPFLQGRAFVAVEAAIQESEEEAERMLEGLRELRPEFDFARAMVPTELGSIHGDPQQPVPGYGDSLLVTEVSKDSLEAFLRAALDESAAPLLSIELRLLGGALAPGRKDGGAVAGLDGAGLVFAVGIVPSPELGPIVAGAADRVIGGLSAYASPRAFRNFREQATDPRALYGDSLDRLREVVAKWDPRGLVRVGHPVN